MAASLVIGNLVNIMPWTSAQELLPLRIVITMVIVTTTWVTVTLLTSRKPCAQTLAFHKKMRIGGPGWKRVIQATGIEPIKGEMRDNTIAWISCVAFIYSLLLGSGHFLFHHWNYGLLCVGIALASGLVLFKMIGRMRFSD